MLDSISNYNDINFMKQQSKINNLKKTVENKNNNFQQILDKELFKNGKIIEKKMTKQEKKLYETCIEMESLFWKQLLDAMKKTTGKYKLLDGGQAEEIFNDMLYDEYSKLLAKNANTNISSEMFKQLSTYLK